MSKKYTLKTIHLAGKGLEKVFGELEAKMMDLIWKYGCSTARCITDRLVQQKHPVSFNSVMTVLNRLVDKKILKKETQDGLYVFIPTMRQKDFSRLIARDIISSVVNDPAFFSVASFNELAKDLDEETIKKLKAFLDKNPAPELRSTRGKKL